MAYYGHWYYPGDFDEDEWFGFVYRIVNKVNGRHYIGKKQFKSYIRKKVKGRKNRKRVTKDSKWREYTGSSKYLNEDIEKHGMESFEFYIESLHKTRGSLYYAEVERQVTENVLRETLDNGERKYYNGHIGAIKFLPPEEHSEETINKIRETLSIHWQNTDHHYYNQMSDEEKAKFDEMYRIGLNNSVFRGKTEEEREAWIDEHKRGSNNPMYGRTGEDSPRYGSHPFANLTSEQLTEAKKKMSHKGEANGMYGRNPFENLTEEEMAEVKKKMARPGELNGMYGKTPYYKMTEEEKQRWKENISKATKGKPKSEETKKKMRKPKGPQELVTCPHCDKEGGLSNMKRYHFDNCKNA